MSAWSPSDLCNVFRAPCFLPLSLPAPRRGGSRAASKFRPEAQGAAGTARQGGGSARGAGAGAPTRARARRIAPGVHERSVPAPPGSPPRSRRVDLDTGPRSASRPARKETWRRGARPSPRGVGHAWAPRVPDGPGGVGGFGVPRAPPPCAPSHAVRPRPSRGSPPAPPAPHARSPRAVLSAPSRPNSSTARAAPRAMLTRRRAGTVPGVAPAGGDGGREPPTGRSPGLGLCAAASPRPRPPPPTGPVPRAPSVSEQNPTLLGKVGGGPNGDLRATPQEANKIPSLLQKAWHAFRLPPP